MSIFGNLSGKKTKRTTTKKKGVAKPKFLTYPKPLPKTATYEQMQRQANKIKEIDAKNLEKEKAYKAALEKEKNKAVLHSKIVDSLNKRKAATNAAKRL